MSQFEIGMIGLGVMGRNLALNLADHGFPVAGYDVAAAQVERFTSEAKAPAVVGGFGDLGEFVRSIRRPRKVILLVKAGAVLDQVLASLTPLLDRDDLVIDGGNEQWRRTEARAKDLEARGLHYFGMGVSGGEEGARHGPSLMPGGDKAAYARVAPLLEQIAAKADGPCVTYVGPGGSGHFVKMVHNGIEYGDMQLIAEAYDLLKTLGGLSNAELADTFAEWNRGELDSFLIEITSRIFRQKDPETGRALVDLIVDSASMKGTGKWTVQEASELGAPIPTIAGAVEARLLSAEREARRRGAQLLSGGTPPARLPDKRQLVADVRASLYAAKVCSYAQGLNLLRLASTTHGWGLDLSELARIWTGGCIIRAKLLARIKDAFLREPALPNLLWDEAFRSELAQRQDAWRRVVGLATATGVPALCTAASLSYYDLIRRERLPANLTQAQRDLFGAHTYERLDKPGAFHTEWS